MTEIRIEDCGPTDRAMFDGFCSVVEAADKNDVPELPNVCRIARVAEALYSEEAVWTDYKVAMIDDTIVGGATIFFDRLDNTHLSEIEIYVHPDHRGKGVGARLYEAVERHVLANGRNTIHIYISEAVEGGPHRDRLPHEFALRRGYTHGLTEVCRYSDHSVVHPNDLDELLAQAWRKAQGYELVKWTGAAPDDVVAGIAALDTSFVGEAPLGDLDIKTQHVDTERVREREALAVAKGNLRISCVIRHIASGDIVALTNISVPAGAEDFAWQGVTIVRNDHRGHKLGLILKIENHRQLVQWRPFIDRVYTWNADVNQHMIAINEALGYRAVDQWCAYEKKLQLDAAAS